MQVCRFGGTTAPAATATIAAVAVERGGVS
jgi:hypothetical protein